MEIRFAASNHRVYTSRQTVLDYFPRVPTQWGGPLDTAGFMKTAPSVSTLLINISISQYTCNMFF